LSKAFIFCNNDYRDFTIDIPENELIIAADGGAEFLWDKGIIPDVLIGDFDSISTETLKNLGNKAEIIEFPGHKDKSDTELSIEYCISNQIDQIILVNAVNGQIHHSLANIFVVEKFIQKVNFCFINKKNKMYFITDDFDFNVTEKRNISLIPVTDSVIVDHTSGLKYSLKDETLFRSSSRGISNYTTGKRVSIKVKSGILLCIIERIL